MDKQEHFKRKVKAEIENIEKVLKVLNKHKSKKELTELELAGIATYIHNYYNGIENILKQMLIRQEIKIEDAPFWHRELLSQSLNSGLTDEKLNDNLLKFLSFRHFFVHSYSFILDVKELKSLLNIIFDTWKDFKSKVVSKIS